MAPCIKPKDKLWIHPQGRVVLPEEKMALQGFEYGTYDEKCVSQWALASLVGNAMPMSMCTAVDLSILSEFADLL